MRATNRVQQKSFPVLYKLTSNKEVQFWTINAYKYDNGEAEIETQYGHMGTNSPQTTSDMVTEGKNLGKKNATSPYEQACATAQSKWEKKLKSGYVKTPEEARSGAVDELIEGGILPMLAHTYEKQGHKIVYPCYVSTKIDGLRLIAIKKEGKVALWTRQRRPVTSCPHIAAEIEKFLPDNMTFDGEIYNHKFKDNFEHITHLARQVTPCEGHEDMEYHIFDIVTNGTNQSRYEQLCDLFDDFQRANLMDGAAMPKYLKMVMSSICYSEEEALSYYAQFKDEGYEGLMLRNAAGLYVNKRSYDLIKMKEMQDAEFDIVGIEEGHGRLQGHAGSFICQTLTGETFNAKMCGDTAKLKEYWEDENLWKGKRLTVSYQNLSNQGIPRFPVGKAIRDYE